MMHFLELSPLNTQAQLSDALLLAKAPLMPNLYRIKRQGFNLGLLKREGEMRFLVITDDDQFIATYRPYYEARFELIRHEGDFQVPLDYQVVYGEVNFGESPTETAEEPEEN